MRLVSRKRKVYVASCDNFRFFLSQRIFLEYTPIHRERRGRDRGGLAASEAAVRGLRYPWVYLRFACRLSIEAFRKGWEAIEQRRLIAVKLRAEPPYDNPPFHPLESASRPRPWSDYIRKGVNRNGSIYMRARGSDIPSNRWCVKSFGDLAGK